MEGAPDKEGPLQELIVGSGGTPDKEGSLEDDGGDESGGSIAGQDGPQEEHSGQVVIVGQLVVLAHPPVQRHDDERQHQLVDDARPQEGHVPEVLCRAPLQQPAYPHLSHASLSAQKFPF